MIFAVMLTVALIASGCQSTPRGMVGKPLSVIEKRVGRPSTKVLTKVSGDRWGPHPQLLSVGDPYLYVGYAGLRGRDWYLFFVRPEVFKKIKGGKADQDDWYLLQCEWYPEDTMF